MNEEVSEAKESVSQVSHLRELGALIEPEIEGVVDIFYEQWLRKQSFYKSYFFDESVENHVKQKQKEHWITFFEANHDDKYIQSRKQLGAIHAQIGILGELFTEATGIFLELYQELFERYEVFSYHKLGAFYQTMHWDMTLTLEAQYQSVTDMYNRTIANQKKAIQQLSTPISHLWENILLLPIVGTINQNRIKQIMERVLGKVATSKAKVIIFDIASMKSLEKHTAKYLLKIDKAVKLMGCKLIVAGISGELAAQLVLLEQNITQLSTTNSLDKALKLAFQRIGKTVV